MHRSTSLSPPQVPGEKGTGPKTKSLAVYEIASRHLGKGNLLGDHGPHVHACLLPRVLTELTETISRDHTVHLTDHGHYSGSRFDHNFQAIGFHGFK